MALAGWLRRRGRRLRAACAAAALLCPAGARAEPESVTIEVEYDAPPTCPDRGQVLARVRQRNPRLRDGKGAEPARLYRVQIEPAEGAVVGSLEQPALGSRRELRAPSCGQLVDALALVLAVSAEPAAPHEGEPEAAGAGAERVPARRQGAGPIGGFGAIVRWRATPGALVGPSVEGEWALSNAGLSAGVALRGGAGVGVNALWYEAAPRVCLSGATGPGACVGFAGGAVDVRAVEYTGRQSALWLAPGLTLRYRFRIAGALGAQIALEGDAPLLRRDYRTKDTGGRFVSPWLAPALTVTILGPL